MSRSAVCGVSVSSPTRNPASTNVRATRSQTSPAASIAIHQQRNQQLTPTRSWNIAPVFRSTVCGQRKASTATTSAMSEASEARSSSHDLHRHSLGRRTLDHRDGSHYSAGGRSPIGDSAQTQQNMAPSIIISNASNTVSAANSIMAKSMVSGSIVVIAERTKHGGAERQLQAQHATVNEQQQRAQKAGSTQHAMHLQRGCQQQ